MKKDNPLATAIGAECGFEHGDQLDTIIGARMISNQLHLYCSWVGKTQCSFVPAKIANLKVPATVIHFYESRLRFDPLPNDGSAVKEIGIQTPDWTNLYENNQGVMSQDWPSISKIDEEASPLEVIEEHHNEMEESKEDNFMNDNEQNEQLEIEL